MEDYLLYMKWSYTAQDLIFYFYKSSFYILDNVYKRIDNNKKEIISHTCGRNPWSLIKTNVRPYLSFATVN